MPALFPFKGFDNEVVEKKIDSLLETKLDVNRFMTVDYQLAEQPGMLKKIRTYIGKLFAEHLQRGDGSTDFVDAEYIEREYRVDRTQSAARWYDDDLMTDPMLIDAKVQYVAESMLKKWTDEAIAEFGKTSNQSPMVNWDINDFIDAVAVYDEEYEDAEGQLFFLGAQDVIAKARKMLAENLKYVDSYATKGYVGHVLGIPMYFSKSIPSGVMFLATKDAVHALDRKSVV